jgi:shikimate kinase
MTNLHCRHNIIFFVGFSGSGKSTVGRKIAKKLGFSYIDLDDAIEGTTGLKISEIFNQKGEDHFRVLEKNCLREILNNKFIVVSCGGGTPVYFNNMQLMNDNGITVYLKMSPKALCHRLKKSKKERPVLNTSGNECLDSKVENLLKMREPFYTQADITVTADKLDVTELMREIKNYKSN